MDLSYFFTGSNVKSPAGVPFFLVFFCWFISQSLTGDYVNHYRMVNVLYFPEYTDQFFRIIAMFNKPVVQTHGPEKVVRILSMGFSEFGKLLIHAAMHFGNGLIIVIEHNDQVVPISPIVSSPSSASPPLMDPSPMTAMIFSCVPFRSLALASPEAREREVDV